MRESEKEKKNESLLIMIGVGAREAARSRK